MKSSPEPAHPRLVSFSCSHADGHIYLTKDMQKRTMG